MSRDITTRCDGCQVTKPEPVTRAWWDFQYTSMDVPAEGDRAGWRFLSASWDLCPDCALKARAALVAVAGDPPHDSAEGFLP